MKPPRYFSPLATTRTTSGGNLPHWSQECAIFVTFRLADSLPQEVLTVLRTERTHWIADHPEPWDASTKAEYRMLFPRRFHALLDAGHGSCILGQAPVRDIVESSLRHFADIRYSLYAFVVKPNHVHVLFMPEPGVDGNKIIRSWKSFTANAINALLGRDGPVWQKESYDHLVRDAREFNAYRAYIRSNAPQLAFDAYGAGA